MKKHLITLLLNLILLVSLRAQVWYPEGVYIGAEPSLVAVENQVMTVGRSAIDATNSYWLVSIYNGASWIRLPLLTLNRAAELTEIRKYQGQIYISGNFTFDNGNYSSLVKFDGSAWQGITLFKKLNQTIGGISAMQTHNNLLLLGGTFQVVGNDTMPFLVKYNGNKFTKYFDCKDCDPDNTINDICVNDSTIVISGNFLKINKQKSKYLVKILNSRIDTFVSTPRVMDKLAINGSVIYSSGGILKDKKLYQLDGNVFTEIRFNIDSNYFINNLLVFDNKLTICGAFSFNAAPSVRMRAAKLEGNSWVEITNNFKGLTHIATGRSVLFAVGNAQTPVSIWNPNKHVMHFYPSNALVKATVFIDSNNNCIREKTEKPAPKQYIKLPFLNKGVFTNENGQTEFMVPNASVGTLRFVVRPFRNYIKSNCADTAVNKTFTPGQFLDSIQFPLNRIPNVNDIRVGIASPKGKLVQKDKRVVYYLTYENVGSNAISGTIKLRKSKLFSGEYSVPAQTNINDSVVQWTYSNLMPGEKKMIVYSALPSATQFDKSFQFDAMVSSSISNGSSSYTEDDFDSIPQEVNGANGGISAFRKDVYPTPDLGDSVTYLASDERDLRYNISFNNFSTDTVFYAVVIDTLDLNLDMSYIQETGSNKSYYTELQTDPNNSYKGIIIWHFPNIKLAPNPTKDYENMNSGAYIGFKVNTKPLSKGYYLKNTASVFYDNNYAGSTNTVYCTLAITDIDKVFYKGAALSIYPNPANQRVVLKHSFSEGDQVQVYNIAGQCLQSQVTAAQEDLELDLTGMNQGIYVVNVLSKGQIIAAKLIVE